MKLVQTPVFNLICQLWSHIGLRRRGQFWLLLILMIITSFAEIISIGAVFPFLAALTAPDRIFDHQAAQPFIEIFKLTSAEQLMTPLTIMFGLTTIMAGALRLGLLWTSTRLSFAIGSEISNKIYRRTMYQPYEKHISRNSSEVINGIATKVGEVIFYVLMPTLNLISASVMLIVISTAILTVAPITATGAVIGFGLIYALIINLTRSRLRDDSQHIARESTNVIKSLQEGLGGIRDILIDGSQEVFCSNYRNADRTLRRAQASNQFISLSPRSGMETLAMLLIATLAYVFSREPDGIAIAIPMLAAIALGMQRLLPALQQVYGAWSTIYGAQASLQDALELLEQRLPDYDLQAEVIPLPFKQQISLRNISMRYNSKMPWVLKDIDLTIIKGSRVGLIGVTGSGKSTLLDILMGLLRPTEGAIEIDEQAVTAENRRAWRSHIAHVPQAIFLVDGSIEENIAFGTPKNMINFDRVKQAARQAHIADIIETLPEKYQTSVGERGIQLSGGQRQRIGIARALYKRADVLIFDESTSALDNETEQAVMQAIDDLSPELTVLIIAHRLSTLKNCTQIIEVSNGGLQIRDELIDGEC